MKKNIIVLYHGDCRDGFSGAWAAWKKFKNKADYFGLKYGLNNSTNLPKGIKNKTIYLIDICLKKDNELEKLVKANKKVVVLDHHRDAEKFVKFADDYRLDNNHSGAVIAWEYFHPKKKTPLFLRYVEDLDIWKRKMPHTFAISAYVGILDWNFQTWSKLVKEMENPKKRREIFNKGNLLLNYEDKRINEIIKHRPELVKFEGYKVYAVNSNDYASQVGNLLCQKHPPFSIIWSKRGKNIAVSLRSIRSFDVSKIAKKFGGGGHKNASGFGLKSLKEIPWKS